MFFLFMKGITGVIFLYYGGEMLVRYASSLGRRAGFSDLLVGLTIVAFGTSAPELVSSVTAILKGAPGIVFGNVLGSNIANIGLVLALSALISPLLTEFKNNWMDFMFLAVSSFLSGFMMLKGNIHPLEGIALLSLFVLYLYNLFRRRADYWQGWDESQKGSGDLKKILAALTGLLVSIVLLPLGADLLVNSAIGVAASLGVDEHILGLTLVAIGTSLPELATSLVALAGGKGDMCLGNILGSNIFNILLVPGVCSLIGNLTYWSPGLRIDVAFMLLVTMAIAGLSSCYGHIGRLQGGLLLAGYVMYMVHLFS